MAQEGLTEPDEGLSEGPVRPEMGGDRMLSTRKSGQCDPACLPSLSSVQEKRTSRDTS